MNEAAWADLTQVRALTLVVRGAESNMLSPQTAANMHRVISDSRLAEVPKAGHLVQGDHPVAFERAVRDFLGI
jgi:pimeloyl-ACP methyl ester carboxylesterase